MTSATTVITFSANTQTQPTVVTLSHTSVFVGGQIGGGISLAQADARYVRLPTTEPDGNVSTSTGSGNSNWRKPTVPLASTNW